MSQHRRPIMAIPNEFTEAVAAAGSEELKPLLIL